MPARRDDMEYCLTNVPRFVIDGDYDKSRPLSAVGLNSGNCLFWEATKAILERSNLNLCPFSEYVEDKPIPSEQITKVVLTLANNLQPSEKVLGQLAAYLDALEAIECKKYLLSIGAQSDSLDLFRFTDEQRSLVTRFFAEFEVVYLRGRYTHDLLRHNSIPTVNCEVVGCPSILLSPIDVQGIKGRFEQLKRLDTDEIKLGINIPRRDQHKKLLRSNIRIMGDVNTYTLIQDDRGWVNFATGATKRPPGLEFSRSIAANSKNFFYSDNCFESIDFFRDNAHLMTGTRVHGTVVGLLAGLPSLCLAIDSRTYELCEQLCIPFVDCMEGSMNFRTKRGLLDIFMSNFDVAVLDGLQEKIRVSSAKYEVVL